MSNGKKFAAWPHIGGQEIAAVKNVLRSGKINQWTGSQVYAFEKEYAKYLGVSYTLALANGSVALDVALKILGIGPGDEVIVPSRTFVASASCVVLSGATPVFADISRDSQNITLESVKRVFSSRTKAIIAVHLAGWPCELDALRDFCEKKGIYLIEDCAQAHGARYKGRPVGSFGVISCFSFCQDKIITTGGEGGLLATNSKKLWQKAWSFKDHGRDPACRQHKNNKNGFVWTVHSFGTNYRMTEMQAAIGRVMLRKLDQWVKKRRYLAAILTKGLEKSEVVRVTKPGSDFFHSYYRYYVFLRPEKLRPGWSRNRILSLLSDKGIPCGVGICPEVYREKAYKDYAKRYMKRGFQRRAISRELGQTSVMLFVHPTLSADNMLYILAEIKKILRAAS